MGEPTIQQKSIRLRIDLALIPCSEEHDSVEPVRRYVDMTLPGNQIIFDNGQGNVGAVELAGALTRQAMQSAMSELALGKAPLLVPRHGVTA